MPKLILQIIRITILAVMLFPLTTAFAQVPPTTGEISRFGELHKAAHFSDITALKGLLENGANIDSVDTKQRMATHIAAFASNEDALTILANAGANLKALSD